MTKEDALDKPSRQINDSKIMGVFLGAAFGDALGWPYENRARNASSQSRAMIGFSDWTKRSGGRFHPHDETIPAGSYSDDTQLIIAVSRSLSVSRDWWDYFATVELPLWLIYERGGGGATLRAARSWLKGVPPWESGAAERQRYFQAGGNGAAMRIAPHVLSNLGSPFEKIAEEITLNSVITHGHPNAIVGALAYGFVLWVAMVNTGTLEYGQLLAALRENVSQWASWHSIETVWPNWLAEANKHGFEDAWAKSVNSLNSQINVAIRSIEAGALSLDQSTLEALGCFEKSISGAGTVAAAAATYLASRYAAGPMEGVAAAAFARGADTDTIASMTGALLGAINGIDWLGPVIRGVQDNEYLSNLARSMSQVSAAKISYERVDQRYIDRIWANLEQGRPLQMPTGIPTTAREVNLVEAKGQNLQARSWVLQQPNLPTIVIKRINRRQIDRPLTNSQEAFKFKTDEQNSLSGTVFAGIGLYAADLDKSILFYNELLGLPIVRRTSKLIQLGEHLVLRPSPNRDTGSSGTLVYIQVSDVARCFRLLLNSGFTPSEVEDSASRKSIVCSDPDGRTVEIFQRL